MVVDWGIVSGKAVSASVGYSGQFLDAVCLLSPAMSLTKICIVGSGSADDARLLMLLIEVMLLERILTVLMILSRVMLVVADVTELCMWRRCWYLG